MGNRVRPQYKSSVTVSLKKDHVQPRSKKVYSDSQEQELCAVL